MYGNILVWISQTQFCPKESFMSLSLPTGSIAGTIQEYWLLTAWEGEDILHKLSTIFVTPSELQEEVIKIISISMYFRMKFESIWISMRQEPWLFWIQSKWLSKMSRKLRFLFHYSQKNKPRAQEKLKFQREYLSKEAI